MEALTAISTLLLAVFTAVMAWATLRLARESREASQNQIAAWEKSTTAQIRVWEETTARQIQTWEKNSLDQIGVQTWMTMEMRFDSREMKLARQHAATVLGRLRGGYAMRDDIIELMESIATLYNHDLMNKQLAQSSFSYYAVMWWEAAKGYVIQERNRKGDRTFYSEFEKFAAEMKSYFPNTHPDGLNLFFQEEFGLQV
jgi:hypothetical protein